jgi:lambda family phage portal protein
VLAYHLLQDVEQAYGAKRVRIDANEIWHLFMAEEIGQVRGVPPMAAPMLRMNNLGAYEDAAVIAARVGASKMGFFTSPDGDMAPLADGTDQNGVPYTDADPGTFGTLPAGYDFKPFDPDYPSAMFGDFTKACLRGIASGLGVAYNALANDLEGVNYSSIRQGALAERDSWMLVQTWFIESFLRPVFAEWLKSAIAFGQITLANGSALPLGKLDKFSAHAWQGRRWQWVDPLKDIEAARLQVKSGVASPQMIAAQNGVDIEDVLADIARFEKMSAGIETVGYVDKAALPPSAALHHLHDPAHHLDDLGHDDYFHHHHQQQQKKAKRKEKASR